MNSFVVHQKVKTGVYKLVNKENTRSSVWTVFGQIVDENGQLLTGHVACKYCFQIFVYHSHKTGTSSLRKHKCSRLELNKGASYDQTYSPNPSYLEERYQDLPSLQAISENLKLGLCKLVKKSNGKSEVWSVFGQIATENNTLLDGVVGCKTCLRVFYFDSTKTGTSGLRKHKCIRTAPETAGVKLQLPEVKTLKKPTEEDKDVITTKTVTYLCKDLLSLSTISTDGFLEFAQSLIDVGANSGHVDAKMLLPDPSTLAWYVKSMSSELRYSILPEIKAALLKVNGAVTLGKWTDDFQNREYYTLNVHYIDEYWCKKERVLIAFQKNYVTQHKTDDIKYMITESLKFYKMDHIFSNIVFVNNSDVPSIGAVTTINCAMSLINFILDNTINLTPHNDVKIEGCVYTFFDVQNVIVGSVELVAYFIDNNLQNNLECPLVTPNETKFSSCYDMLHTIYTQYDAIQQILVQKGAEAQLPKIDLLKMLVDFLEPFKKAVDALHCKEPNLHLSIVWYKRLIRHLQGTEDQDIICALKGKALGILHDNCELHLLQKIALFLHPKLKSLKLLDSEEERQLIRDQVKSLISEKREYQENDIFKELLYSSLCEPPDKKVKMESLSDVEDSGDESTEPPPDEIQRYVAVKFPKTENEEEFKILQWWQANSSSFPNLANLARYVFAIPSSSSSEEKHFSTAGLSIQVIQEKEQFLHEIVDDILFLHSNLPKNY